MQNLTCIVCPIGCSLDVKEDKTSSGNLLITGNQCPRGAVYAQEEIRAPKRTVTATCGAISAAGSAMNGGAAEAGSVRRIPVKTSSPCPKEKIPALLRDIYKTTITLPVKAGDTVISCWQGEGIDVVATRTYNL